MFHTEVFQWHNTFSLDILKFISKIPKANWIVMMKHLDTTSLLVILPAAVLWEFRRCGGEVNKYFVSFFKYIYRESIRSCMRVRFIPSQSPTVHSYVEIEHQRQRDYIDDVLCCCSESKTHANPLFSPEQLLRSTNFYQKVKCPKLDGARRKRAAAELPKEVDLKT